MEIEKKFPTSDVEGEEVTREMIAEGKRRIQAVVEIDKLFEELDKALAPDDMEIVGEIKEALEKNRKILEREDGSGVEEVRDYYWRLDRFLKKSNKVAA